MRDNYLPISSSNQHFPPCLMFLAYYIQQCHKSDQNVDVCLKQSANKFARYVQKGIPELEIEDVNIELLKFSQW